MAAKQKQQATFDLASLVTDLASPAYVHMGSGDESIGVQQGDLLLVDRGRTKPRDGEIVAHGSLQGRLTVGRYDSDYEYDSPLFGVVVTVIRKLKRKRRTKAKADPTASLKKKLEQLERVPENEAIRFELETEIFNLEHETEEEWPDHVGER